MSTLINTTKIVLLVLCAAGGYATWYLLMNNGTALYMQQLGDARLLPGTKEALKTVYTGIPALDHQLAVLCVFFWEIVDGSNPSASLHGFQFATQAFCAWGLLMIEGMRTSHRWKIISLWVI